MTKDFFSIHLRIKLLCLHLYCCCYGNLLSLQPTLSNQGLKIVSNKTTWHFKMAKPSATVNQKRTAYQDLANLGNIVFLAMSGNINFATPSPSMAQLQLDITDLEDAIAAWGPLHNRGSHLDLLTVRAAALTVYNDLIAEAAYVTNAAAIAAGSDYALMATIIASSGLGVKNSPTPQGPLAPVQDFHQMISAIISIWTPKLKWLKPTLLQSPNNVKYYIIFRGDTNDFSQSVQIGTSTKTSFIDLNAAHAHHYYYWVAPFNAAGMGAVSPALSVSTPI